MPEPTAAAAAPGRDALYPQSGPVFIDTPEYVLRTLTPEDVSEHMLSWFSLPDVLAGLNLPPLGFDYNRLKTYIARFDNKIDYFIGIFSKRDQLLVGFYTVWVVFPHMNATLTSAIGEKSHESQHVHWKTIDALLDYFYRYRGIYKIKAPIIGRNFRMFFNFMQNARFELEAVLRNECVVPGGGRTDILVFTSFSDDGKTPDTTWEKS